MWSGQAETRRPRFGLEYMSNHMDNPGTKWQKGFFYHNFACHSSFFFLSCSFNLAKSFLVFFLLSFNFFVNLFVRNSNEQETYSKTNYYYLCAQLGKIEFWETERKFINTIKIENIGKNFENFFCSMKISDSFFFFFSFLDWICLTVS